MDQDSLVGYTASEKQEANTQKIYRYKKGWRYAAYATLPLSFIAVILGLFFDKGYSGLYLVVPSLFGSLYMILGNVKLDNQGIGSVNFYGSNGMKWSDDINIRPNGTGRGAMGWEIVSSNGRTVIPYGIENIEEIFNEIRLRSKQPIPESQELIKPVKNKYFMFMIFLALMTAIIISLFLFALKVYYTPIPEVTSECQPPANAPANWEAPYNCLR